MKVKKVYYEDDYILVPGHLIKRKLCKPMFYPFENRCGFSYQIISKKDRLVEYNRRAYLNYYKEIYKPGMKVYLMELKGEAMRVPTGSICTVQKVDDYPIIHCICDGKHIGIMPEVDAFQLVEED